MKKIRYNIILRKEPEGGFTVVVPALPGCITYGRTLTEAQRMAADAIRAYVTSLRKHREPIPSDEMNFIGTVELAEPGIRLAHPKRKQRATAYA